MAILRRTPSAAWAQVRWLGLGLGLRPVEALRLPPEHSCAALSQSAAYSLDLPPAPSSSLHQCATTRPVAHKHPDTVAPFTPTFGRLHRLRTSPVPQAAAAVAAVYAPVRTLHGHGARFYLST